MALINTSVPNLIQGVSQQPDATRFAGQCEEQENALSSVADGLKKRPNTRHIAKLLTNAIDENSFVHFINRDDDEKYVIIHDGTHLYAYSIITGVEQDIKVGASCYKSSWTDAELAAYPNYVRGGYPVSNTYLDSATARASLKALTIADSTFLLNTESSIGLGASKSPTIADEALLFIKQGDYEKKYGFSLDVTRSNASGVSASITFTSAFNVVSYQRRCYISGLTLDANNAGSGFAVDDIVDIPLVTSKTIHHQWSNGLVESLNFRLWLFTQPTMRVTHIGTNGSITGAVVENAGSFAYAGSNYSYSTKHGLGVDTSSSGPYYSAGGGNRPEVIGIPTTNNTAITGNNNTSNKVTLKMVFQSGTLMSDFI